MVNFREMFDKITRFPKIERNIVILKSCGVWFEAGAFFGPKQ